MKKKNVKDLFLYRNVWVGVRFTPTPDWFFNSPLLIMHFQHITDNQPFFFFFFCRCLMGYHQSRDGDDPTEQSLILLSKKILICILIEVLIPSLLWIRNILIHQKKRYSGTIRSIDKTSYLYYEKIVTFHQQVPILTMRDSLW